MKKIILTLIAAVAMTLNASAQTVWKMVVTQSDGTQQEIAVSDIKDISYKAETVADKNIDQVIIKELYCGGCPQDEGTSYFSQDKGFILYNNCPEEAVINNLCVGMLDPFNAHAFSNDWYKDGVLTYENAGYVPAATGIWWFQQPLTIPAYSQVVVSMMGSIDNTATYSQSVNYANKDYYAMYDPESGFSNTRYYPTPADVIPTSHYLKAYEFGMGNAWSLSVSSPAFFIFQVKDTTPAAFAADPANELYAEGAQHAAYNRCLKVPTDWILDGVEVYDRSKLTDSRKRFPASVDAGYVLHTSRLGHSLYRNVDEAATKAIAGNADKLVYGYSLGVDPSTDPSGIDAEASIQNGAKIVYMDTNNSTNDFHERQKFSLRK